MKLKAIVSNRKNLIFVIAIILAAVIKQLLVVGMPIYAIPGSACDDQLMKSWAYTIAAGQWLGTFNAYTFMKEPGFAIFLAICYRLHLHFIFIVTLGYSVACIVFSTALDKLFSSRIFVYIIYIVLLFNPAACSLSAFQRVYRNGLGMILTLLIFGSILHMYFSVSEKKCRKLVLWSCIAAVSLGCLWITKSDTVWIMPFTIVVTVIMAVILLRKCRNPKSIIRYVCLIIPFLGILFATRAVDMCSRYFYGYSSVEYYAAATYDMTHVKTETDSDKISLTRETMEKLYDISPTLASVESELNDAMDKYAAYDTVPEDGEVEDGWVGWAFIDAFDHAGVYATCESANEFYKNVYNELEEAFAAGVLEKVETTTAESYYIDTGEHRRQLIRIMADTIRYMSTFDGTEAAVEVTIGGGTGAREYEILTRENAIYADLDSDYFASGWIVFSDYSLKDVEVFIEDADGNQQTEITFYESEDVYDSLKGTEGETEDVQECRFDAEWDDADSDAETTDYFLCVYQGDECVGKVSMQRSGFDTVDDFAFTGVLDTYISQTQIDAVKSDATTTVARVNAIGDIYQAVAKVIFYAGIVGYLLLTVIMIIDLTHKKYDNVNAWLLTTGFILSIIVFSAGIAVVHLTQCPAINSMYLSSVYALMLAAELIPILKCLERILQFRRK